jgi:replicative DNA helicase
LQTAGEKETYKFIVDYAEQNGGQAPDYRTAVAECDQFVYYPQVEDSYEYLTKQIKSYAAKAKVAELFNGAEDEKGRKQDPQVAVKFGEISDGNKYIDWLIEELIDIKNGTEVRSKIGVDFKADIDTFMSEYRQRKEGKSFKIFRSKFPTINREIGGYYSGNLYTWYGRSGRGKSVFTMEEALEAAQQGANVLVWSLEMSEYEWLARAYSSMSGRYGVVTSTVGGVDYDGGFSSRELVTGKLTEDFETALESFLRQVNEQLAGSITLRAADTDGFLDRSVAQLQSDILQTKADVVCIDPIYLMDFEANTSKVAGGDVANTSKKLRRIAGQTKTVIHIVTQADEVSDDRDEGGERELRPPRRSEIKKSKSVLEDSFNTIGIDTCDGRGLIDIAKGRMGGEGVQFEVLYLPQIGLVREMSETVSAEQFGF